jgi:nucleoside-diphosphate-sugar epimerase
MKIGITGGNGFIGTHVQNEIRRQGHTPFVLDHKTGGDLLGDVRDKTIVSEFAAHVDAIIHLAAVLGTSETIDQPWPAAETNILGTLNVFDAASAYNLPTVFAAVGNSAIGRGTYCITKTTGEEFVKMYREDRGLPIIAVRPMNAYGPGQSAPSPFGASKVRKIVPTLTCNALSGHPMPLYGGGRQISDAVYVEDVAHVFVEAALMAHDGIIPEHPIDVGGLQPLTVKQIAEEIIVNVPGAHISDIPMRKGEPEGGPLAHPDALDRIVRAILNTEPALNPIHVRRTVKQLGTAVYADTETLHAIGVDAATFTPIDKGIRQTVDWFRQVEGKTWNRSSNPNS